MAWKQFNLAADLEAPFDSPTQRAIFMEACYRADRKGTLRLAQSELAQITGWSLATIKREFGRLQGMGLLDRAGHGRYKIGLPDADGSNGRVKVLFTPEQASAEQTRLQAIMRPGQGIGYSRDGWPTLINMSRDPDEEED